MLHAPPIHHSIDGAAACKAPARALQKVARVVVEKESTGRHVLQLPHPCPCPIAVFHNVLHLARSSFTRAQHDFQNTRRRAVRPPRILAGAAPRSPSAACAACAPAPAQRPLLVAIVVIVVDRHAGFSSAARLVVCSCSELPPAAQAEWANSPPSEPFWHRYPTTF